GVDRTARPDHRLPPATLAGDRMNVGDMLVASQRMADQDRVAARSVERAVGLIRDLKRCQVHAGIEPQWFVSAETNDQRMRLIRFTHTVGGSKYDLTHHHILSPADRLCPAFAG